jgi:hypothetical protein
VDRSVERAWGRGEPGCARRYGARSTVLFRRLAWPPTTGKNSDNRRDPHETQTSLGTRVPQRPQRLNTQPRRAIESSSRAWLAHFGSTRIAESGHVPPEGARYDQAVILRCTGKLLALFGTRQASLPTPAPSDDDWYANLLWLDRRKCLLLVHAGTLFPVFGADVRKAALNPIGDAIVGLIRHELVEENLPIDTFGELKPGSVSLARTASRVVLGYMNEMARYCEYVV